MGTTSQPALPGCSTCRESNTPPRHADLVPSAGLDIDPSNAQLKEGLEAAQKPPEPKGDGLFGPQFMAKLAMDPTTQGYLQQPDFMQMLRLMQQNPQMMSSFMQDPRFSKALSVSTAILGLCMICPDRPALDDSCLSWSAITSYLLLTCRKASCPGCLRKPACPPLGLG